MPSPVQLCTLVIYICNDVTFSSRTLNKINSSFMMPLSSIITSCAHITDQMIRRRYQLWKKTSPFSNNIQVGPGQVEILNDMVSSPEPVQSEAVKEQMRKIKTHVTILRTGVELRHGTLRYFVSIPILSKVVQNTSQTPKQYFQTSRTILPNTCEL